jgi:signal transduction histidine kinase
MNNITGLAVAMQDKQNREYDLSKAKEVSEQVSHFKAIFLANMSHELRTPLNAIIGISSLLQLEESLDQEQRDLVEIIRNSGEELLSLINNILSYSKIEAGKITLEIQPFCLPNCIESALEMFSQAASSKGLKLACSIDENVPAFVIGDQRLLEQILENLLENAIKFTDRGEVEIYVSSDPNDLIHFTVKDTGIGIPVESMDRLFESFRQADDSLTRKHHGIGLGLATTRRLVELMDGQIWVESREGDGSAFHFAIKAKPVSGQYMFAAVMPTLEEVGCPRS